MKDVILYGKNNCPSCDKAKFLLESNGVKFSFVNCDEDYDAFDKMVQMGHRSFPQLYTKEDLYLGDYLLLKQLYSELGNLNFLK